MRNLIDRTVARLRGATRDLIEDERGDVPGWVLITLMTAGFPWRIELGVIRLVHASC